MKTKQTQTRLWKGPQQDGITQSLLSQFLVCRERFRLLVMEGLKEREAYNHKLEYGNLWHTAEEYYHQELGDWKEALHRYSRMLKHQYGERQSEIDKWLQVCLRQFQVYTEHWAEWEKGQKRKCLEREEKFSVWHVLPSGDKVRLRGKMDSLWLVGNHLYMQENKAKGSVNEDQLRSELPWNLQLMFYVVALRHRMRKEERLRRCKFGGVFYNVIRRPLGGFKFNIQQRKGRMTKAGRIGEESLEEYYDRLESIIRDNVDHFFVRARLVLTQDDIDKFEYQTLNPLLQTIFDWWNQMCQPKPTYNTLHWRMPYGVYSPLANERQDEYTQYLATGDTTGLEKVNNLFPEL